MKLRTLSPLLLILAAACAPLREDAHAPTAGAGADGCARAASRAIAFTHASARDVLDVSASGPDCEDAIVTIAIRPAGGPPAALFSAPLARLQYRAGPARTQAPEELAIFLQTYADAVQFDAAASTLPEWKADASTPGFNDGLEVYSPLERARYETLRRARPNMLCMMDGLESSVCYVWDVRTARAVAILRTGG